MVEDIDERRVCLPVNLAQFYAYELHLPEHMGVEEVCRRIERTQKLAVFFLKHGFQLIDVADEKQLLSAERHSHIP